MTTLYRRTSHPGAIPAVPLGDLTEAQFQALRPDIRREVRHSPLYEAVDPDAEAAALREAVTAELGDKTRDELNEAAARLGVPDPEKLKSKDAVLDAIVDLGVAEVGGN